MIKALEVAITQVHEEPGVELYALHEGRERLVMVEKYESEEARSEHAKGAALANQRSALEGMLWTRSSSCPTRPETRVRARCDR
jgi:quinol monooxygenase YgiN